MSPNVSHWANATTATVRRGLFEPLNGAGLFSTVVKPRAYLDTPSAHIPPNVSHWANDTHRRYTAGFYYGVPWRAATRINVFCRGEARLARHLMTRIFALCAIIS